MTITYAGMFQNGSTSPPQPEESVVEPETRETDLLYEAEASLIEIRCVVDARGLRGCIRTWDVGLLDLYLMRFSCRRFCV